MCTQTMRAVLIKILTLVALTASSGAWAGTFVTTVVPDVSAPVFTTMPSAQTITGSSAMISWASDKVADSRVYFGTAQPLVKVAGEIEYSTAHAVKLTKLLPNTNYSYQVVSVDPMGNKTTGAVQTFTTSTDIKSNQTIGAISFAPATLALGGTTTASATATSGLGVTFSSSVTPTICSVSGSTVNALAAGTCTVAADQLGNSTYNAAPQVTASITIGQATQTITFGTAPSVIVGGTGTISTTGGGSGIARVYSSTTLAACAVNSSTGVVTGVTTGTNNCTINANQAGNANYSAAVQASLTFSIGAASVVPVPPEVPAVPTIPPLQIIIVGMKLWPQIVNLNDGEGPAFTAGLMTILSNALGMPLQFVEQNAKGTVILRGYSGGNLAFIPLSFQTGDARADGIYAVGNGQFQVVRNGQSLVISPAVVNLEQLVGMLPAGSNVTQADNGVVTATFNGQTYVIQPGVFVLSESPRGSARFEADNDGFIHFIDAAGNNQILYPAFEESENLRNILRGLDFNSSQSIELDGTATILFNGQRYKLVPDMTLSDVPSERNGQAWWQEGPTRYRLRNSHGASQGFNVRQ